MQLQFHLSLNTRFVQNVRATVCHRTIRQRQDMNTVTDSWGWPEGLCSKFPTVPAPAKDILNTHVKVYVQNVRLSTELHLVTRLQEVRRIQIAVEGQDPFYLKTGSP